MSNRSSVAVLHLRCSIVVDPNLEDGIISRSLVFYNPEVGHPRLGDID